jgi:hypothetical protein
MIISKKVEGKVDYDDGEFEEVKTIGIERIEKNFWLGTVQIPAKYKDTPDEFRQSPIRQKEATLLERPSMRTSGRLGSTPRNRHSQELPGGRLQETGSVGVYGMSPVLDCRTTSASN